MVIMIELFLIVKEICHREVIATFSYMQFIEF